MMSHYFLAIKLPSSLQAYYHEWQIHYKNVLPYKKWTAKEDLHITLKFLDEVDLETIEILIGKLKEINQPNFNLEFEGLNFFGSVTRPRVLYVEVVLNKSLLMLQRQIIKKTEELRFKSEKRPFTPHVTLAKKWGTTESMSQETKKELQSQQITKKSMEVSEFLLYKIHPGRKPSYECIQVFPIST
jgi:2'-5' RNA ligase